MIKFEFLQTCGSTSLIDLNISNLTLGTVMCRDHQVVNVYLTTQTKVKFDCL